MGARAAKLCADEGGSLVVSPQKRIEKGSLALEDRSTSVGSQQGAGSVTSESRSEDLGNEHNSIQHATNIADEYAMSDIILGTGSFGVVYAATQKASGIVRAVKTIVKVGRHRTERINLEIIAMKSVGHPNIVQIFETFEDARCIHLSMELCHGGELYDHIMERGRFSEVETGAVMLQMLLAVSHMHEYNIVHRDLKPENFLFLCHGGVERNVLKLIDFGLACTCGPSDYRTTKIGTPSYMAPEVVRRKYDRQCDMWSIGVIMYILLCGNHPFAGKIEREIISHVLNGQWAFDLPVWEDVSEDAKGLIRNLLETNPDVRFTAEAALRHDWVK